MKIKFLPAVKYLIVVLTILRLAELIGIAVQVPKEEYGMVFGLTTMGYITDIVFVLTIILILTLLFKKRGIPKGVHYFGMFLFHVLLVAQLLILVYYVHQRIPLGIILYQHTYDEIFLTATNSGYSMTYLGFIFLATIFLFVWIYWLISKYTKKEHVIKNKRSVYLAVSGGIVYLVLESFFPFREESYYVNNAKYFLSESVNYYWEKTHPMDLTYNAQRINDYQSTFKHAFTDQNFPLVHTVDTNNYLADYFNPFNEKPNIVFLIVEGLNDDFIHEKSGLTLMPYLSHLKEKSLYWEKCFTLGERSFAAVPSLLGSLPYGTSGFMQLDAYPRFTSMANVLKSNDYHVRFNYGQGSWFHSKDRFFKWQNIDVIFDKAVFNPNLPKMIVDDGYFWGYDDITFLSESIKNLDKYPAKPFMEVYFTGSMHSPYIIPQHEKYLKNFRSSLKKVNNETYKSQLQAFEKYYLTTQVTDSAIQQFMEAYAKRPEYNNTIFIITGDHPMTEAPVQNSLKRYHVPLLVYSPKLKRSAVSKNVVSHLDVQQTLFNILRPYDVNVPQTSAGLGNVLKVEGASTNSAIAFMNGHRFIEDLYLDGYFLTKNQLYKVKTDFQLEKVLDANRKKKLEKALESFKWMSLFSTTQQRLLPVDDYLNALGRKKGLHYNLKPTKGSNAEYVDWLKNVPVSENCTMEIYFKDFSHDPSVRIVVALKDKKENSAPYFYKEIYCNAKSNYSEHVSLQIKEKGDLLQVYVYNPNHTPLFINSAEVLLHQ